MRLGWLRNCLRNLGYGTMGQKSYEGILDWELSMKNEGG